MMPNAPQSQVIDKACFAERADIAIIGMAGRFPGAGNIEQFWRNLCEGVESISFLSEEQLREAGVDEALIADPGYVKAAAALEGAELFDAAFFGYSPREAEIMDPQHRILLETAWEALEDAGYDPSRYEGSIGVFAGATINTYLLLNLASNPELIRSLDDVQINVANGGDFLTTRISYKLNLKGPSHLVQSACSTSLVAVHVACRSLLSEECDMALAGGVSVNGKLRYGYRYLGGGILSPDGHCRAFDAKANGTIFGSGAGMVALKRLEDAIADRDSIYAIIKSSAVNNDGSLKVGYTAPSVEGQAAVISEAIAGAGVGADTITYIEAHGTGTTLGDPIEIQSLTKAFRAAGAGASRCAIGSVKTNVGHLDAAAGVAGLIKTALALDRRILPPSLHFERPNPQIAFDQTPFYVNSTLSGWKTESAARRAGVSAFGVGGTNAHVILEEAPTAEPPGESRPIHLLLLSAKTPATLERATANLGDCVVNRERADLADIAYTLAVGRQAFTHRRALVCRDSADAVRLLGAPDPSRPLPNCHSQEGIQLVFMFPGQGAQRVNMGAGLYRQEKTFRSEVDRLCESLEPHLGLDLREILYPPEESLSRVAEKIDLTAITQPALFMTEYAMARMWMSWGVSPSAMIGHSIGEYVAACLAGVMTLEDALKLVAARGRIIQRLPRGAMLSVGLGEEESLRLLEDGLSLASINSPRQCVISGPIEAIEELERRLLADETPCRRLKTSHAFHSAMMDEIAAEFDSMLKDVKLSPPKVPYISNLTGAWIKENEATSPDYWVSHLRRTVRFAGGVEELLAGGEKIFLEVGPGQTLTRIVSRHFSGDLKAPVISSLPGPRQERQDLESALTALGNVWMAGAQVDWKMYYGKERRQRVHLPTYPFERQRYWIEANAAARQKKRREVGAISGNQGWAQTFDPASMPPTPCGIEPLPEAGEPQMSPLHPRPALPDPYIPPAHELELEVVGIWQKALGIEQVGVLDNFFDLGGDSLLAVQVISELRKQLKIEIPVVSLYECVTVRSLVELVNAGRAQTNPGEQDGVGGEARGGRSLRRKEYQQGRRLRKR
jgi:phthiocerol/phenolphthiocerol synthesis type-I polyketide synthase E